MHAHAVLMLAAAGFVWLFGALVVVVTLLVRRGRIANPDRRVPLGTYGPLFAGALSGGAAAVHAGAVGTHAASSLATASAPIAFLCSIAAGPTHFTSVDAASAAGLLPLGVLSLGVIPLQAAWTHPRLWAGRRLAVAGVAVTAVAVGLAAARTWLAPPAAPASPFAGSVTASLTPGATGAIPSAAMADALGLIFEVVLLAVVALLVWGRPRQLAGRFVVRVQEAWILGGAAIGGVALLVGATLLADHAPH